MIADIERRLGDRDPTLNLHHVVPELIATGRDLSRQLAGAQSDLNASRAQIVDRDQRLERAQFEITRLEAVVSILRERMQVDLASHALAQASLEAFDKGAVVIPGPSI